MRFTREFYIPAGSTKITDKESDAVAYLYQRKNGNIGALGFHGRAQKPDFHYSYTSDEKRSARVKTFFESRRAELELKATRKAEEKATGRGLNVGDVLRCSWGYDQTNIDYYEVTGLIGKTMVEIREINCFSKETSWAQGESAPAAGQFIGKPMRRVAKDGAVRMNSFSWARKMEPASDVAGVKVYKSSHWTAYA